MSGKSAFQGHRGRGKHQRQPESRDQHQKDRAVVSGPVPADAEKGWSVRLYRAGRRAFRLLQGAQSYSQRTGGEPSAAGGDLYALRRVQALCGRVHGGAGVHQDWSGRHGKCVVL